MTCHRCGSRRRARAIALSHVAALGFGVLCTGHAAWAEIEPLALVVGTPVELACRTRAMVVGDGTLGASEGEIILRLELSAPDAGSPRGRWQPIDISTGHTSSMAFLHGERCRAGCPLIARPGQRIELWAPQPAALDGVPPDQFLSVAALDPASLALRISTFRAKELHALEDGQCRRR